MNIAKYDKDGNYWIKTNSWIMFLINDRKRNQWRLSKLAIQNITEVCYDWMLEDRILSDFS